jgi:hypothetical protein
LQYEDDAAKDAVVGTRTASATIAAEYAGATGLELR